MVDTETSRQLLQRYLSYPIDAADAIFEQFESLPGAIAGRGEKPLERYVCIPGSARKPIVLVAHCDTVWDEAYGHPMQTQVCFENGVFKGTNPQCGIGADDRAGCAMLWALRDCGHTLLLVNGEEKGKVGAKFLRKSNPELFHRLNRHQFMIELDWQGSGGCLFNQVEYTKKFYRYVTQTLNFTDDAKTGGCDLQILCQKICGVNIGVGYHGYHRPGESLSLAEWESTLARLKQLLSQPHPRFRTSKIKMVQRYLNAAKKKLLRLK